MGRERIDLARNHWLSFDRYEIRNRCIAPAKGASRRVYDPWDLPERPYQSLAKIVLADRDVLQLPAENPELLEQLLEWVNQYGLLGTFTHRVQMVSLWPRWQRMEFADGEPRDIFEPVQEVHVNLVSTWHTRQTCFGRPVKQDISVLGTPLAEDEIPQSSRRPSTLLKEIEGSVPTEESLAKGWGRYFPGVPFADRETFAYPPPDSDAFWNAYSEPVSEFVLGAWLLANGIDAITRPQHENAIARGAHRLSILAQYGAPRLVSEPDGSFAQRWEASSLLAAMAFMAIEDITRRVLHQCPTCHRLFTSTQNAEYCSAKCRQTMQKRRYRERLRSAPKQRRPKARQSKPQGGRQPRTKR